MKSLALVVLVATAFADVADPDTVVLTDSNFDRFIESEKAVLVEFYAPWCGHCKNLAPEYAKAATALKKFDIQIGKLDATEYGSVASKYDVSGYPTLKVFRAGKPTDYNGPREAAGIIQYMKKEAAPAAEELASDADIGAYVVRLDAPVFVGSFKDKDSTAAKDFIATANANRDYSFAVIYGAKEDSVARYFPATPRYATGDAKVVYEGKKFKGSEYTDFLASASLPLVGVKDSSSAHAYDAVGKPTVTVFVPNFAPENDPAGVKYYVNRVKKVAADYKDKLTFALASGSSAPFELHSGKPYTLGVTPGKFRGEDAPAKGFDKEGLKAFVDAFLAGEVEEFLKSEPIPDEQGDVKVLVGKNFKAETEGKAGLIEFYAPWCGHCKNLAPTWDKLGKKAAEKAPNVLIAKMDATANDVPAGFDVTGFPTIYYVDADGEKTKYQGGRDLKDFVKYLKGKGVWE